MDPRDNATLKTEEEIRQERREQAIEFRKTLTEKLPRQTVNFGIAGRPESEFAVLRTPATIESTVPGGVGNEIPVQLHRHLVASPAGVRVLEFIEYGSGGPKSYEQSEERFSKDILSETVFRDPTKTPGITDAVAMQNAPFYSAEQGQPEFISFSSGAPFGSLQIRLEDNSNPYIRLRRPAEREAQELIDFAKKAEGIVEYSEDISKAQNDVETMSSVQI